MLRRVNNTYASNTLWSKMRLGPIEIGRVIQPIVRHGCHSTFILKGHVYFCGYIFHSAVMEMRTRA